MQKLIFAHQLRGLAALLVVASHLIGVYWGMRDVVAQVTFSPPLEAHIPPIVAVAFQPYYLLGPLGVSLFFLISGFVISFSISKSCRLPFLLARLFRIYPTYVICSFASLSIVALSALYWGQDFQMDWNKLISNLLLIHNYAGYGSIDLVNWSLAIEIKFYLLMALIAPLIVRQRVYPLFVISLVTLALHWFHTPLIHFFSHEPTNSWLRAFTTEMLYISYMLIGVLFYYHYSGRLSHLAFALYLLALSGINSITWAYGMLEHQFPAVTINYGYAIAIFLLAYTLRGYFRPQLLLDQLGNISYPLYIVHSLVGYSLMRILMNLQLSYEQSLVIALTTAMVLAYTMHRLIELPSNRLGKQLAAGFAPPTTVLGKS